MNATSRQVVLIPVFAEEDLGNRENERKPIPEHPSERQIF